MPTNAFFYAVVLGLLLGTAELMGRYRDDPFSVFKARAAWLYVGANGVLAAISLYLIQALGLSFTPDPATAAAGGTDVSAVIYDVIMAGFGGAAFFRSSVMKAKVSDTDVAIGPATVIDTLLKVTDREVDRSRAEVRAQKIAALMSNINLSQTSGLVLPFCTALMQNMSAGERESLAREARSLATDSTIDSRTKPMVVALRLVNVVGFDVLESAVDQLREQKLLPLREEADKAGAVPWWKSRIRDSFAAHKGATGDGTATGAPDAGGKPGAPGQEPGAPDEKP